ncbi:trypsin-like serine peptidase [Streptomyces sp. O3]
MRSIRPALAAVSIAAALALTATACGSSDDKADGKPTATASTAEGTGNGNGGEGDTGGGGEGEGGDGIELPSEVTDRLKEQGIDLDKWKEGGWQDWDKDKWLREAKDFANPVIDGLWDLERMGGAKDPDTTVSVQSAGQGETDPTPRPVTAKREKTPYHQNSAAVGKIFFDSPKGSMVCSGTVVKDPRHPGKSNLVWTAGHCIHAGGKGGWYRNIMFVPSYNDLGKSPAALRSAAPRQVAPYGQFWATWGVTSSAWIKQGGTGNAAWAQDYAVLKVRPGRGGKSLEETVGTALDVDFSAPSARSVSAMGAWGYPAAPPHNGALMYKCVDRPGRLTIAPGTATMYRIGCTMTGGASGGGWFYKKSNGQLALVSNTSIGPAGGSGWVAGPQLGAGAKRAFDAASKK